MAKKQEIMEESITAEEVYEYLKGEKYGATCKRINKHFEALGKKVSVSFLQSFLRTYYLKGKVNFVVRSANKFIWFATPEELDVRSELLLRQLRHNHLLEKTPLFMEDFLKDNPMVARRTAQKVLTKLMEQNLVYREAVGCKFAYYPTVKTENSFSKEEWEEIIKANDLVKKEVVVKEKRVKVKYEEVVPVHGKTTNVKYPASQTTFSDSEKSLIEVLIAELVREKTTVAELREEIAKLKKKR